MADTDLIGHEGNLSARAYALLKDMIRRRELRGGEVVGEARLSEAMEISRTPLREALQRLEGEGLVVKSANRSFVVRRVDLSEYLNSINVRILLEVAAVGLAFGNIPQEDIDQARAEIHQLMAASEFDREGHWRSDNRVHGLIIDNCGNPVLAQMIRTLRVTTNLFEIEKVADRLEPDTTEHLVLLDKLEHGTVAEVKRALRKHLASMKITATRKMLA